LAAAFLRIDLYDPPGPVKQEMLNTHDTDGYKRLAPLKVNPALQAPMNIFSKFTRKQYHHPRIVEAAEQDPL